MIKTVLEFIFYNISSLRPASEERCVIPHSLLGGHWPLWEGCGAPIQDGVYVGKREVNVCLEGVSSTWMCGMNNG